VTLIPVAKGFQKQVAKQLDGVGGAGGKAGQATGKNFSDGFGGQLKKLGLLAAGALATAGVGRLLGDSIKQASDLGESLNAVNVVFEESAAGIAKIGEAASKNLGLSQTEFNAAAVQFSSFAEKIAGDGGDVVGTIDELTTRGADFASVMNLEVSEALQVFQSGLAGETEPLKKFGIDLSAASVEAFALESGIIAAGESMTESQKVQARYGALMEQTAKTSGDFSNTSDSLANQQRILNAEFANVQASIGVALIPVLEKLQGIVIDKVLPAFEDFGDWLESPAGTAAVEGLTNVITGLVEFTIDLVGAIGTALPILAALGTAFIILQGKVILAHTAIGLATIAQIGLNAAMAANPIGLIITALAALAIGIGAFINATNNATPSQEELNQKLSDTNETLDNLQTALDNGTISQREYEIASRQVKDEQRELRGALQDSYNWTEAQTDASYRARDAALAQRNATIDLRGETDKYTDSIRMANGALISNAVLEEAQYNFLQDYNYSLGTTTKTLQDWIDELTERNFAQLQGISTSEFYSQATDDIGTSTAAATTTSREYTTAVNNSAAAIEAATPANQEFLDVLNGVATVEPGTGIQDITRDIQNMIVELDKANELTMLENGFVEFMRDGQKTTARFDPETGELLESFTEPTGTNLVRSATGEIIDTNALNRTLQGEFGDSIREVTGATTQAINDAILGSVTLTDPETGMSRTVASSSEAGLASAIERAEKEGYVNGGGFEGDVKELISGINKVGSEIGEAVVADAALASGGLVTRPTKAIIGEAGPEMVIPLNKFENMMGAGGGGKSLVYNAAPNQSMDSEQELFTAMRRASIVAGW
jgi:hypothetical protein